MRIITKREQKSQKMNEEKVIQSFDIARMMMMTKDEISKSLYSVGLLSPLMPLFDPRL
jgi:hypothetical protein